MPIQFTCPHCGAESNVADQYAGRTGPCSSCGNAITIPNHARALDSKESSGSMTLVSVLVTVGVVVLLTALLIRATTSHPRGARRAQCMNHTKQIVLALHCYHDTHKTFPPAYTTDENGKPMHSWRVLILPFIEETGDWERYDYDQPWDSPHNLAVAETIPGFYQCPSSSSSSTDTNYMVITGPGTLFEGTEAKTMRHMARDGISNTAIVVEVAESGVLWTQPIDVDIEAFARGKVSPEDNLQTAGVSVAPSSYHPGIIVVGFADGRVDTVSEETDPKVLRAMATISGGEPIADTEY